MELNKIEIGNRIKEARKQKGLTQSQLADKFGYDEISFQSISLWENGNTLPSLENLIKLSDILDVSLNYLVIENPYSVNKLEAIYDLDHMKTFIKTKASTLKLNNTLKAIPYAYKAHEGVNRKKSDVPYIYHPLSLACRALSLGIKDDHIIAACILHDVIEDAVLTKDKEVKPRALTSKEEYLRDIEKKDLPVSKETSELVYLLSHQKENGKKRGNMLKSYYEAIANNPKASLIKCLDRADNLCGMAYGLSKERQIRYVKETEEYIYKLLDVIKAEPKYNNAYFILSYEIKNLIAIYKKMI